MSSDLLAHERLTATYIDDAVITERSRKMDWVHAAEMALGGRAGLRPVMEGPPTSLIYSRSGSAANTIRLSGIASVRHCNL